MSNWKAYDEVNFNDQYILRWIREGDEYVNRITCDMMEDLQDVVRQQAKELDEAGGMIGVLREYISDLENGLDSSIKLNKAQAERNNEPVAWVIGTCPDDYRNVTQVLREAEEELEHYKKQYPNDKIVPLYTHPVKELTDEDRSMLIRTLKWSEDLLRVAGHDEAVNDVQDCLMILRKAQEK